MNDLVRCPICNVDVRPMAFQLWPGAEVMVCPTCRIGIADVDEILQDKAMKQPQRDKMLRGPKRAKQARRERF